MSEYCISVSWKLLKNNIGNEKRFLAAFHITNEGDSALLGEGCTMFYNQTNRKILKGNLSTSANVSLVQGDFYKVDFSQEFALYPNQSVEIKYEGAAWLTRYSDAPSEPYFIFRNHDGFEKLVSLKSYCIKPFDSAEKINRCEEDMVQIPTPAIRYEANRKLKNIEKSAVSKIIPTPMSLKIIDDEEYLDLTLLHTISTNTDLKNEAEFLAIELKKILNVNLNVQCDKTSNLKCCIELKIDDENLYKMDSYELSINENFIFIHGYNKAGIFYGIQSLIALIENSNRKHLLSKCRCTDSPRFSYRGLMIDVARNFHPKETMFHLIDVMSMYKLNRLHIHLTDDEGWRLHIEKIPELTEFGAARSHTVTEESHLQPSFGSGPTKENTFGTGFYSRKDFVEILSYANSKHIQVVPEINVPGHARAAIKAMDYRYKKHIDLNNLEAAEEYVLSDLNDTSKYTSVQLYADNVISVGQQSAYKFYETVIDEIISMYNEAGATLTTIHTGGDEVPKGVWKESPICTKIIDTASEVSVEDQLVTYFMKRISAILKDRNLITAGWEEVGIKREKGKSIPNPDLKTSDLRLYVWKNLSGSEDLANRLANFGYDIILCNATHLYFDLAYDKDPDEPGLYWAGFTDTKKAYRFSPENILLCIAQDVMGKELAYEKDFADHEKLNAESVSHIKGIQGQLWGETITKKGILDYYTLPRLLALAERAWVSKPSWETLENRDEREALIDELWNGFANTVGQFELNRLTKRGYNVRIPMPGAIIKNGYLYANTEFPGLEIRYTADGRNPDEHSEIYTEALKVEGEIKLRAFNNLGCCSRVCAI